jgi:hypothetical protein
MTKHSALACQIPPRSARHTPDSDIRRPSRQPEAVHISPCFRRSG